MNAIPQIIAASIALLVVFLLGCIIGWFLRTIVFRSRSKYVAEIKSPSIASDANASVSQAVLDKSVAAKVTENSEIENKPSTLSAPRNGKKDDLKTIKGVGPKLETVLNELGIYHFDQIASWTRAEIEWVDDYLSFKGRIERDDWISQAKSFGEK